MKKQTLPTRELLAIVIGELITSLIVSGVFLIIKKFDYTVVLGLVLGSAVTFINFLVLSIMTNKVIDRFLTERGNEEMDEEEAAALAMKFQGQVQNQMKLSFIIRIMVMIATFVLAFLLTDVFNVIATMIPLLMTRPIITVSEFFKKKRGEINEA
jgi:hypothetical protein